MKWRGIQYGLQDRPLVELRKGLTAARTATNTTGFRLRSAREALSALREADRSLAGARRARCRCLRRSLPHRRPSRIAFRTCRRFSHAHATRCRSSSNRSTRGKRNNRQSDRPPRTLTTSSNQRARRPTRLQMFSKTRKQPDRREFAQQVANMAKFEAVLVRQRTDDAFWQVAHGPVARSFFGIIHSWRLHYLRNGCI